MENLNNLKSLRANQLRDIKQDSQYWLRLHMTEVWDNQCCSKVQYTTRCAKKLIVVLQTITKSDRYIYTNATFKMLFF